VNWFGYYYLGGMLFWWLYNLFNSLIVLITVNILIFLFIFFQALVNQGKVQSLNRWSKLLFYFRFFFLNKLLINFLINKRYLNVKNNLFMLILMYTLLVIIFFLITLYMRHIFMVINLIFYLNALICVVIFFGCCIKIYVQCKFQLHT